MVDIQPALKDRLHDREMLVETVSTDVRSSGIIVTDLSQVDAFKFAHKSFFELVVASNFIYTCLALPLSKDKVLHHAARTSVDLSSGVFESAGLVSLGPEMIQFTAEILHQLTGGAKKDHLDLDRAFVDLGIPIKALRRVAVFLAFDKWYIRPFAIYVRLFMVLAINQPLSLLSVLAAYFKIRGQGGAEFIKYEAASRRRIRQRLFDQSLQHVADPERK